MHQHSFYPLRTIVGKPVEIARIKLRPNIRIIDESPASKALQHNYEFILKANMAATQTDSRYSRYLPVFDSPDGNYAPGNGMETLPVPAISPFSRDAPVISLFGLSDKPKAKEVSRQLSVKLSIKLAETALVGGICFAGFPFLPYKLQANGQNSANFGLPREIRLASANHPPTYLDTGESSGFLDFVNSVTRQEIISHSGFHYLHIDPTLTDSLILHLSDYPTFITKATLENRDFTYEEHYGFVLPYFYVFQYQEKTRYKPGVPAGLLGARYDVEPPLLHADYVFDDGRQKTYVEFTAASILGQQRTFASQAIAVILPDYREAFISKRVNPGEKVTLYIQQAEEFPRCIAGFKLLFPFVPEVGLEDDLEVLTEKLRTLYPSPIDLSLLADIPREELERHLRALLAIPAEVNFCEKIGIRVYELDPVEGVSPVQIPLDSKYATLLADKQVEELEEIINLSLQEGIRFIRPSTSKYFAIVLTNLDDEPGQFVARNLQLIQSAHVSIHPRASRTQQVSALHFRLIGSNLADDYALLGDQGFNFSIERLVAGERKNVLLRVNSLLDLLHTGAAKIFSNGRRRGVERETTIIEGGQDENYDVRRVEGEGWRSSETGVDVSIENGWKQPPGAFEARSSQELRAHNEILSPNQDEAHWRPTAIIGNALNMAINLGSDLVRGRIGDDSWFLGTDSRLFIPTYKDIRLFEGFDDEWAGVVDKYEDDPSHPRSREKLRVSGTMSVTTSPFGFVRDLGKLLDLLDALVNWDIANITENAINLIPSLNNFYAGGKFASGALNSLGLSLSANPWGIGLGLSTSTSGGVFLPSFSYVNTFGTQGSKTLQATRTGSARSQYKNISFDEVTAGIIEGKSRRKVTREEVPGEDKKRVKGAEVMWQGELQDILTGSIPLNFTLPATASKEHYRTADDSLRVRLGSGVGEGISVDFWFDIVEEMIQDDY